MMRSDSIQRLHDDLATIRQAVGIELPFGRADVNVSLLTAACGALIAIAGLVPWTWRGIVALPLVVMVAATVWSVFRARRHRAANPSHWREHRLGMAAALVFAPLAVLYMQWEKWTGMPRGVAGAAGLFFIGLGALVVAVVDRRRLYYAGGGLPLMVMGLALPLVTPRQFLVVAGLCILCGGAATATIQMLQLRRQEPAHGSH